MSDQVIIKKKSNHKQLNESKIFLVCAIFVKLRFLVREPSDLGEILIGDP